MERPALPQPGETIAGKYALERVIGEGGMSVVYGATHRVTGKRFAIKWMLPEPTPTTGDTARRFIREAQVAGLFQHPNVVEVYDVGQVSGSFYMVMEWLDGESLASRLERTGAMSFEDVCAYLIPCMHGVTEAHSAGIVHRDLKPANIFLCRAMHHTPERPKVLDFGIAKISAQTFQVSSLVTKSGVLIGTPHYLSPEQLRSQPVDHRTDVYAFGVIMYQLLTGMLPFPADNFGALALQIASGTPEPLATFAPNLPEGVAQVVARAMALEPSDRFQSVRELRDAVEALRDGEWSRIAASFDHGAPASPRSSAPRVGPPPLPSKSNPPQPSAAAPAVPAVATGASPFANRKLWRYASVAALVLGAAGFALARLWLAQSPDTSAHDRSPPAQAAANARGAITTTAAATDPASTTAPRDPPQPPAAPETPTALPSQTAPATAPAAPAQADRSRGKRARAAASSSAVPAPSEPAATQAPPATNPLDRNPLHMRLQ